MANMKLLQEAIEAFANGEQDIADKKMRKYFVEQAQEINKELEEAMDDEECPEDEEKLEEDFNQEPDTGLNNEIQYSLGEEDETAGLGDDEEVEFTADADVDGHDVSVEGEEEVPDEKQWASINDAFRGLQKMFDEISAGGDDIDLAGGDEAGNDLGGDEFSSEEPEGEDEFADVSFGDEKVGESFKLKNVAEVDKKEKAGVNKKSPVASQAKSPVQGVEPVKIGKSSTPEVDDKFDGVDTLSHTVPEDMDNVMDNAKGLMKDVKKPANSPAKSRSPLPKSAPKF